MKSREKGRKGSGKKRQMKKARGQEGKCR